MRKLTVERRKTKAEERRVSDSSIFGLDGRTVSGTMEIQETGK